MAPKIARGGGGFIYDVHSSMFTLLSGATRDPGHSTKIMRGGKGWAWTLFLYCQKERSLGSDIYESISEFLNNKA